MTTAPNIQDVFDKHKIVRLHLARKLGLTHAAIGKWRLIPAGRAVQVEAVTGINRVEMRPDLFGDVK